MLTVDSLVKVFDKQFNGKDITPSDMDMKLRKVNELLEIHNGILSIRFSFGEPIDDEHTLDDWKEIDCFELKDIPSDRQNRKYTVYEIWYD